MGCDIHLHTEIKIHGRWEHYGHPNMERCYPLFARMAGVRNYSGLEQIAPLRGLPADVTLVTRMDWHRSPEDWHSPSWLGSREIEELEDWLNDQLGEESCNLGNKYWGYLFDCSWAGFRKYPGETPEGIEDVRFVFWFDD